MLSIGLPSLPPRILPSLVLPCVGRVRRVSRRRPSVRRALALELVVNPALLTDTPACSPYQAGQVLQSLLSAAALIVFN